MTQYPKDLKSSIISKMLPPLNQSVSDLAKETGIPYNTLYTWRASTLKKNGIMKKSASFSPEQKLNIIMETACLSQAELSAYCREKGLFPEEIAQWKANALS
ncbi:transposase (plasmid) [Vibrio sp. SS-MA-C1-2]|uniref:transposase n=1 Tax=Vibrio sp. SS-MA-C1-2 TaxID=2908646 RepID=UPI001F36E109|nr:transposase [Vibrio sp. SS-MA-C1-2]UJF20290.1 transposase [Vibrio sp. SS-MA-C1-2]